METTNRLTKAQYGISKCMFSGIRPRLQRFVGENMQNSAFYPVLLSGMGCRQASILISMLSNHGRMEWI
jgi:hypothetical protein